MFRARGIDEANRAVACRGGTVYAATRRGEIREASRWPLCDPIALHQCAVGASRGAGVVDGAREDVPSKKIHLRPLSDIVGLPLAPRWSLECGQSVSRDHLPFLTFVPEWGRDETRVDLAVVVSLIYGTQKIGTHAEDTIQQRISASFLCLL